MYYGYASLIIYLLWKYVLLFCVLSFQAVPGVWWIDILSFDDNFFSLLLVSLISCIRTHHQIQCHEDFSIYPFLAVLGFSLFIILSLIHWIQFVCRIRPEFSWILLQVYHATLDNMTFPPLVLAPLRRSFGCSWGGAFLGQIINFSTRLYLVFASTTLICLLYLCNDSWY